MKKFLLTALVLGWMVVAAFSGWCYAAEGTKTMKAYDTIVTVPEKAPDFIGFDIVDVMRKRFPNGTTVTVIEIINAVQNVGGRVLLVDIPGEKRVHVLVLEVAYKESKKIEFYVDAGFLKTGNPSDKLIQVETTPDFERIFNMLQRTQI